MAKLTTGEQNVSKSMTAMNTLQDLDDYDIICLQEPYIMGNGKLGGLPSDVVAHYSSTRCRAIVTVLNKSLPVIGILTESNGVAVSVDLGLEVSVLVVSVYLPPKGEVNAELGMLKDLLDRNKKNRF